MPCYMIFSGSIPTAADCLAAIKKVVFEDRFCSPAQLLDALRANFEGYEELRHRCLAAPKFGNDDDDVDRIAADMARRFCNQVTRHPAPTGKPLWPALYNFLFNDHAKFLGATPDGRRWKDPICEHYSPTPGRARRGPTAVIRSAAKGPLAEACGSSIFHVSLPRSLAPRDASGSRLLLGLLDAARALGVAVMNTAIYDTTEMRDAQRHPERHQDLIVRVWGFCARFVDLSTDMQEHIIDRTCQ